MARLQDEPIDVAELILSARADGDGALALFVGTVRDHNAGRRVQALEYHAYDAMAVRELETIEAEACRRFEVRAVSIVHRTGRLAVGEPAVAVAVAGAHRAPAFEACRWAIDTLKRTVPIWKREYFDGGEVWVEGAPEDPPTGT